MAPSKQSHTVTKCKQSTFLLHFELETKRQRKKREGKPKAYSQRSKPRKPPSAQNKGISSPVQKALPKSKLATWGSDDHSKGSDVSAPLSSVQPLSRVQLFATPWTAARQPPCPSQTPRACSNPCPLSRWCHPSISSSVIPLSSCLQSFPTSGSFSMSQLFASGGQSIGDSASASVFPMNIQDWSPLGWTGWISLQSKGLSRVLSNTTIQKHQFFSAQLSSQSNSHIHIWPLEKP